MQIHSRLTERLAFFPRGKVFSLRCLLALQIFLGTLICCSTAAGEGGLDGQYAPSRMTLPEALALGLQRNFSLRSERLEIPVGQEEVFFEAARFHPSIRTELSASGEKIPTASAFSDDPYQRSREYGGRAGLEKPWRTGLDSRLFLETFRQSDNSSVEALDPDYRSFLVLELEQPLLRDFGAETNTSDLRIARNRSFQSSLDFLANARDLGLRIENAYYGLAAAQSVLEFRREHLALTRELLAGNRKKFERGIIAISEVQEAETAIAGRQEELILARQEVESAVYRLQNLLELEGGVPGEIDGFDTDALSLPEKGPPVLESAIDSALRSRTGLEAARLEIASRNIRLQYLANQKLPRLDLKGTLGVNGLSGRGQTIRFEGFEGSSPHTGDYPRSVERMAEADGYEWSVGMVFSYPLGNEAAESRYRQADWRKRQAIYNLKRLENGIETEVRNALATVLHARKRVEVAQRFVDLARTSLEQEMQRLRNGLSDTFRILRFQSDLIDARTRRVDALLALNQGLAELYRATGLNLERHGLLTLVDLEE